jgi:hypothetical protein
LGWRDFSLPSSFSLSLRLAKRLVFKGFSVAGDFSPPVLLSDFRAFCDFQERGIAFFSRKTRFRRRIFSRLRRFGDE